MFLKINLEKLKYLAAMRLHTIAADVSKAANLGMPSVFCTNKISNSKHFIY